MKTPDYKKLNQRFSPTFYITLISIIQSLAFGSFLYESKDDLSNILERCIDLSIYIPRSLIVLLLIFLVWYEYAMSTSCFRWNYNLLDSVLPFIYGIIQYLLIIQRLIFGWLWYLCIFLIISFIAYLNMEIKERDNKFKEPLRRKIKGRYRKFNYYFIIVKGSLGIRVKKITYLFLLVALVLWFTYAVFLHIYLNEFLFLIFANTMIIAFIIVRRHIWNTTISNKKRYNL